MALGKSFTVASAVLATGLVTGCAMKKNASVSPHAPREEIEEKIAHISGALEIMREHTLDFAVRLQSNSPYVRTENTSVAACFTLANQAAVGTNYGTGQINVQFMEMQKVEAAPDENGRLVPKGAAPGNYFASAKDFMAAHADLTQESMLDPGPVGIYAVKFPEGTYVGCVQDEKALREDQADINVKVARAYDRFVTKRIQSEVQELRQQLSKTAPQPKR